MLSRRLLGVALVVSMPVVALFVGQQIAAAQAGGGAPPDASGGVARNVTLSPPEQAAQAEGFIQRMDATRSGVRRSLESARAQRDVVKTLCLNDKLNQIDVAIRSARDRKSALDNAVTRNDVDLANHEYTILTVLKQRSDQLSAEAAQCIGEEGVTLEEGKVITEIDPGMPDEDPSNYPHSDVVTEPPSCSSCYQ